MGGLPLNLVDFLIGKTRLYDRLRRQIICDNRRCWNACSARASVGSRMGSVPKTTSVLPEPPAPPRQEIWPNSLSLAPWFVRAN